MFTWLKEWRDTYRKLREPNLVTEEMVYAVIPTIWIRKMKVRERLLHHYPELKDKEISNAQIYIHLKRLEVIEQIECDVRRYPKIHYDVGICRKTGLRLPSTKIETSLQSTLA